MAEKHGKDYYNHEITKNSSLYNTPRSRDKLIEYSIHEYGYDKAKRDRPDLYKKVKSADIYWDSYKEECKKVSDKLLGEYGNTKLYENEYYSLSIRDTVGDMISSMERNNWKI